MPPKTIQSDNIAETALQLCTERLAAAVDSRGSATFVLSGGSTPLRLYALLAQADLPWTRIHVFWGDERFVPHDHADSNYGAARRALLNHIDIPEGNVHPWPILENAEASAEAYSDVLQSTLGLDALFDVTLLGLGSDGHTASLFPGTGTLRAQGLTVASRPAGAASPRLSLTASALSSSRAVIFLVSGEDKRPALESLLAPAQSGPGEQPARAIAAREELLLVTDL